MYISQVYNTLNNFETIFGFGLFLSFLPKKISNIFSLFYFFILILFGIIFQENNINTVLGFVFFLTFSNIIFLKQKNNNQNSLLINENFIIFLSFYLISNLLQKVLIIQFVKYNILILCFISFEILSIVNLILFNLDNNIKNLDYRKNKTLQYVMFHLFIGFIFLISINIMNIETTDIIFKKIQIYGIFFIFIANSAFPGLSFWLINTYGNFNFPLFLIFINGISKISVIFLLKIFYTDYSFILGYIGIISSIISLLFLLHEDDIKKFLCISILSQNYIILLFNPTTVDLNLILFNSIIAQILFSMFIILIINFYENKNNFFSQIEILFKKNIFLFFIYILIAYIFCGMPGTPNFWIKGQAIENFKNLNSLNYYLVMTYKILNIIIFFFVFPYKIFNLKKDNFIRNKIKYLKYAIYISIIFIFSLFLIYKNFSFSNIKYFEYILEGFVSALIFLIFSKTLMKNITYKTSELIYSYIKNILHNLVNKFLLINNLNIQKKIFLVFEKDFILIKSFEYIFIILFSFILLFLIFIN